MKRELSLLVMGIAFMSVAGCAETKPVQPHPPVYIHMVTNQRPPFPDTVPVSYRDRTYYWRPNYQQ